MLLKTVALLAVVSSVAAEHCVVNGQNGFCWSAYSCDDGGGYSLGGGCSGSALNRCCIKDCNYSGYSLWDLTFGGKNKDGRCMPKGNCPGPTKAGLCPGDSTIQCCKR